MSKQVDRALADVFRFPNYFAWRVYNPVARAMVGATDEQMREAYEEAFDAVLVKVGEANAKDGGAKA